MLRTLLITLLLSSCNYKSNIPDGHSYSPADSNITFYKQKHATSVQLTALFTGRLVLKNNCLLIENQLGNLYHPAWPHDVSLLSVDEKPSIVRANKILLKLNEIVELGGGQASTDNSLVHSFEIPKECNFRFWLVHKIIE